MAEIAKSLLFAALLATGPAALAETVTLTSLEWCPYSCSREPGQGVSTQILREAFKLQGYELEVRFLPWNRAVYDARNDAGVAGYFPEYQGDVKEFHLSAPVGYGPLGLVEPVDKPLDWKNLDDLSAVTLGVVSGYLNSPDLDERIAEGRQPVDVSMDDAISLRKVAAGRIGGAVVDSHVFHYLMAHDAGLQSMKTKLRMNPRLLDNKSLHVAFADTELGRKMAGIFAEGLKKLDVKTLQANFMHNSYSE